MLSQIKVFLDAIANAIENVVNAQKPQEIIGTDLFK